MKHLITRSYRYCTKKEFFYAIFIHLSYKNNKDRERKNRNDFLIIEINMFFYMTNWLNYVYQWQ